MQIPYESIVASSIAFGMGLVKALLAPAQRGLLGFFVAFVVAIICGVIAGVISAEFGLDPKWQYVFTAAFAVTGDQFVFFVLPWASPQTFIETQNVNSTVVDHVTGDANIADGDINSTS